MQLAKAPIRVDSFLGWKGLPHINLKESFLLRLEKARQAYQKRVKQYSCKLELPPPIIERQLVGWLLPLSSGADVRPFEITKGVNYLVVGEETKIQNEKPSIGEHLKIVSESGALFLSSEMEQKFHGDEISFGSQKFILKLFSSQSYVKWILLLLLAIVASSISVSGSALAQNEYVNKSVVPVVLGDKIKLHFTAKGLDIASAANLEAKVTVNKREIPLEVVGANKADSKNVFLVDTSSLCVSRKMEELINLEVSSLIKSFSPNSVVTLVEFSRRLDSDNVHEVYRKHFENRMAKDLLEAPQPIKCDSEAKSVNALEAIHQHLELLLPTKGEESFSHKRLFVISSGNVRPVAGLKELLAEARFDFYPLV